MGADLHLVLFREGMKGVMLGSFGSAKTWPIGLERTYLKPDAALQVLEHAPKDRVNVDAAVAQVKMWDEKFPGCLIGFDDDCRWWSLSLADTPHSLDEVQAVFSQVPEHLAGRFIL